MTDLDYLETVSNAFAMGIRRLPHGWDALPAEERLAIAKDMHRELISDTSVAAAQFRQQHPRLFGDTASGLSLLKRSSVYSVVIWVPVLHVGGADQWVVSLCKYFARRKVRPLAVVVRDRREVDPLMVARMPSDVPLLFGQQAFAPSAEHADAVVSWGLPDLPMLSKGIRGKKPVFHVLHHPSDYKRPDLLFTKDVGIRQVAVCPGFAEQLGIECVENGADVDRVLPLGDRDMERERLGLKASDKVILYVGRFSKEKNVPGLIDAFRLLPKNYHLILAGPHIHRPDTINVHHERILCHPAVDGLHDLFAAADCLAQPSRYESHGLAINEAWLAGVPTVSCSYPANVEFQKRFGQLSWLVPVDCFPGQLAGELAAACCGKDDARVGRAMTVATTHFTAEKMCRRWEQLLLG